MTYQARSFKLPALKGISEKQIKVHLGLYEGYVKHVNLIMEKIRSLKESDAKGADKGSAEGNTYLINELRRRFAFEFDGMRMHELYFSQFEGGLTSLTAGGAFGKAVAEKYGSTGQGLVAHIKEVARSRGIGWVVVYSDPRANGSMELITGTLHTVFVNDHEVGQLAGLPILLALDLWEHAYMVDYVPAEKKNYIDAFFDNLNWSVVEKRFDETL